MQKLAPRELLNPKRFTSMIARQPEFVGALAGKERHAHLREAVALGALAVSRRVEEMRGENDLDANLYHMIGQLSDFYESQKKLDSIRDRFGSFRNMPPRVRDQFRESKDKIIEFNHTLHELINVGASRISFDELVDFMTHMHRIEGGENTAEEFHQYARSAVIGMRNEMAYEQILIAGGIDYAIGDVAQDSAGEDFNIDGIPIDVKASENQARAAREKAIRDGRNPHLILWSRINFKDFDGRLTLPYEKAEELLPLIMADLANVKASLAPHPRRGQ